METKQKPLSYKHNRSPQHLEYCVHCGWIYYKERYYEAGEGPREGNQKDQNRETPSEKLKGLEFFSREE